ncbi:protein serine threonine phosphatase 2C [Mycena alexandri]|uniref:Protein serine threonine phosphatase 2C n=1 Tax=Mycena alexandri TaxID=1745969 RepID=A0AAD6SS63_9AGAR|nr:protein serine threonine phosphatase 2C [Mycena alexandri]
MPQTLHGATYTILAEPHLSTELSRHANPQTLGTTHVISIQPCPTPSERTQDRFVVTDWALADGTWKFQGVFDGHAGHETVDHVVATVPTAVHDALVQALAAGPLAASDVSELLRKVIADVDAQIGQEMLDLFPGGAEALVRLRDEDIAVLINDNGVNSAKVLRCMRGSTVLVALISPALDVWVASLGDCQAVLGSKQVSGMWDTQVLSANHNAADADEVARIRSEHPSEDECVLKDRVLGAIAITRAVGDFLFKLPAIYTHRVFLNSDPGFRFSSRVVEFLPRNLTPPYLSAQSDVQHVNIPSLGAADVFLLLASDGLVDLSGDTYGMDHREPAVGSKKWVEVLSRTERAGAGNAALYLLRHAMGWEPGPVSALLTAESEERQMDDTTILFTSLV